MKSNYNSTQFNLNRFFKEIHVKKQYFKKMQNKVRLLNELKESDYKKVGSKLLRTPIKTTNNTFVMYIIDISFSKKNTLLHVSDSSGNIKFFIQQGRFNKKEEGKYLDQLFYESFIGC